MPLIYGEGVHAFIRLQLEIIKSTADHSIFASTPSKSTHDSQDLYEKDCASGLSENRGALTPWIDDFENSRRITSSPDDIESSFEMTNLGLRISLWCIVESTLDDGRRNLLAYLDCFCDLEWVGIRLREAKDIGGKPSGRFYRYGGLQKLGRLELGRNYDAQFTVLHIIQPTRRHEWGSKAAGRTPCSVDYGDLVKAGYQVERLLGPSERSLYKDNFKVIFEHELGDEKLRKLPWIFIFKHAIRTTRFWVLIGIQNVNLGTMIKIDSSKEDPPASIYDAQQYQCSYDIGYYVPFWIYANEKQVSHFEIVKLSVRRALISSRPGYMIKAILKSDVVV
jgi:hypothetical protein